MTNVWIVTEYDGGGIRGLYASQSDAELAIEGIRWAHPDLTRSDFVIQVHRLPEAILSPQTWQPIETAPNHERVLLSDGHYVVMGDVWDGIVEDDEGRRLTRATHWRPRPELPPVASLRGGPAK